MKTKQELYVTVSTHLATQGQQAMDSYGTCLYRTDAGLKCAFGILIPDEYYVETMERTTLEQVISGWPGKSLAAPVPAATLAAWGKLLENLDFIKIHSNLLIDLQRTHDRFNIQDDKDGDEMKLDLKKVGEKYELNTDFLNELDWSGWNR